jgi:hypothetical protein
VTCSGADDLICLFHRLLPRPENPGRAHIHGPWQCEAGLDAQQTEKEMADSINIYGGTIVEDVAYKLLYAVAWAENIDLEGWGKTDRKWILNTYAECLLSVQNPAQRMTSPPASAPSASAEEKS